MTNPNFIEGALESCILTQEDIEKVLPHKGEALLLKSATLSFDRVNETGAATAKVQLPALPGHFPKIPVVRGMDILETAAQLCAVLGLYIFPRKRSLPSFVGFDKTRFYTEKTGPEETLCIEVKYIDSEDETINDRLCRKICRFRVEIYKEATDEIIAESILLGSVTFFKRNNA